MFKIFFLLVPFFGFSQIQIGQDIDGEAPGDLSGTSLGLSSDGNTIAIGARNNDGNGNNSGHVRIYYNELGSWVQMGSDINGDPPYYYPNGFEQSTNFGFSVSLSGDGTICALSSINHDISHSGTVRVYEYLSSGWTQIGSDIDGESQWDYSGSSISLSSDGSIIAISATFNDANGPNTGHVRVFENQSGNWVQVGSDIDGDSQGDKFGTSTSLSNDGSIIAIGTYVEAYDLYGCQSGYVRVFENQFNNWIQIGNNIPTGHFISLSGDGNIVATVNSNIATGGCLRIYENQLGVWTQIGQDITGEQLSTRIGQSVSLSDNGNIVAIPISNNGIGSIRIYENQSGTWNQIGLDIHGEESWDAFGSSISLSSDGSIVAGGAYYNDEAGENSGHVRVFDLSSTLSIDEFNLNTISIYPNPTKQFLNIALNNSLELQRITVYNSLGQKCLEGKNTRIDISKFSKGMYFVEIVTNRGKKIKKIQIK